VDLILALNTGGAPAVPIAGVVAQSGASSAASGGFAAALASAQRLGPTAGNGTEENDSGQPVGRTAVLASIGLTAGTHSLKVLPAKKPSAVDLTAAASGVPGVTSIPSQTLADATPILKMPSAGLTPVNVQVQPSLGILPVTATPGVTSNPLVDTPARLNVANNPAIDSGGNLSFAASSALHSTSDVGLPSSSNPSSFSAALIPQTAVRAANLVPPQPSDAALAQFSRVETVPAIGSTTFAKAADPPSAFPSSGTQTNLPALSSPMNLDQQTISVASGLPISTGSVSELPFEPKVGVPATNPPTNKQSQNEQSQSDAANPGMQTPTAAILSALGQSLASVASTSTRLPALKTTAAPASSGVHKTPQSGGGVSTSTPSSESAADDSPLAGQTPFSVFFSSPGPGTEAAAATLPKVVVPVTNEAVRNASTVGVQASSASSQGAAPENLSSSSASGAAKNAQSMGSSVASQASSVIHGSAEVASGAGSATATQNSAAAIVPAATVSSSVTSLPSSIALPQPASQIPQSPQSENAPEGSAPSVVPPPPTLVATPPGPVQVAQMANRVGQSEMRIGMNTSSFGSVEVRTVVHASDVGLTIGSERGDLRGLMTSEIPALSNSLQQQNLRLNSVHFMQGQGFSNPSFSGGSAQQQRSFNSAPQSPQYGASSEGLIEDSPEVLPVMASAGVGSLSVLA